MTDNLVDERDDVGIAPISDLGRIARSLDYSAVATGSKLLRTPEHVTLVRTVKDARRELEGTISILRNGLGDDAAEAVDSLRAVDVHLERAGTAVATEARTSSKLARFLRRPIWDDAAAAPHLAAAHDALSGARRVLDRTEGVTDLARDAAMLSDGPATAQARAARVLPPVPDGVSPEVVDRWATRHGDGVQTALRGVSRLFGRPFFKLSSHGAQHIPRTGPVLIAPIHGSDLDTLFFTDGMQRNVRLMANHKLMARFGDGTVIRNSGGFPVDNTGGKSAEGLQIARTILMRERRPVLMFWEGRGVAADYVGEPKAGVARLAIETGAPIVPVGAYGTKPWYTRLLPVNRKVVVYGEPIRTTGMGPEHVESLTELLAQRSEAATRQAEAIARGT